MTALHQKITYFYGFVSKHRLIVTFSKCLIEPNKGQTIQYFAIKKEKTNVQKMKLITRKHAFVLIDAVARESNWIPVIEAKLHKTGKY